MVDQPYLADDEVTGGEVFTICSPPRAHPLVPLVGSADHLSDLTGEHGVSAVMRGGGVAVFGGDVT